MSRDQLADQLADDLKQGNRRSLAKAITLVESKKDEHRLVAQTLIEKVLPQTGKSLRIGISGTPGVGKSTFIESFGNYLITQHQKKVAVLAIDPSSPVSGGSILGDKTRMETLAQNKDAFIRPSPTSGSLGGVALKTRETIYLCEAAGFDIILVETVGVGQSEFEVASMVDFFTLLVLPGGGDEIQGIKKGILELSDLVAINKSDGNAKPIAQQTLQHYQNALSLFSKREGKDPIALTCSAMKQEGLSDIWQHIVSFQQESQKSGAFDLKRSSQNMEWLKKILWHQIELKLAQHPELQNFWETHSKNVESGKENPYLVALNVVNKLFHQ